MKIYTDENVTLHRCTGDDSLYVLGTRDHAVIFDANAGTACAVTTKALTNVLESLMASRLLHQKEPAKASPR